MILGFAPASKDSSMTLNIVFSFGFSYENASVSKIARKRYKKKNWLPPPLPRSVLLALALQQQSAWQSLGCSDATSPNLRSTQEHGWAELMNIRTFSDATRSAACSNVKLEISSTILLILGSEGPGAGGEGDIEGEVVAAVASRLNKQNTSCEHATLRYGEWGTCVPSY